MNKEFLYILAMVPLFFTVMQDSARAGEPGPDVNAPAYTVTETHATANAAVANTPLTLYQNTIEIITLYEDAGSIILSNPAPVELIVETSRRLVLRPIAPGVTSLTVISAAGQVIYRKDIVVSNRGKNYVNVKRYCEGNNCEDQETYFCPNGCYDVSVTPSDNNSRTGAAPAASSSANYNAPANGEADPMISITPVEEAR